MSVRAAWPEEFRWDGRQLGYRGADWEWEPWGLRGPQGCGRGDTIWLGSGGRAPCLQGAAATGQGLSGSAEPPLVCSGVGTGSPRPGPLPRPSDPPTADTSSRNNRLDRGPAGLTSLGRMWQGQVPKAPAGLECGVLGELQQPTADPHCPPFSPSSCLPTSHRPPRAPRGLGLSVRPFGAVACPMAEPGARMGTSGAVSRSPWHLRSVLSADPQPPDPQPRAG